MRGEAARCFLVHSAEILWVFIVSISEKYWLDGAHGSRAFATYAGLRDYVHCLIWLWNGLRMLEFASRLDLTSFWFIQFIQAQRFIRSNPVMRYTYKLKGRSLVSLVYQVWPFPPDSVFNESLHQIPGLML